ncbi:hypothetical protein DFJ73DRAFT_770052 [Zopfochytrium polystomum]|nr:hypothetical protein DFJ73DRAFT_770052 [Zopfochytrium polystomum]
MRSQYTLKIDGKISRLTGKTRESAGKADLSAHMKSTFFCTTLGCTYKSMKRFNTNRHIVRNHLGADTIPRKRVFRHRPEDRAYYRMHGQVASRERNWDKRRKAQYIRYHLGKRLQVFLTDIQPSPTAASGQTKARFERARRRWMTKLTAELGAERDERFNPRIELNILAALERELNTRAAVGFSS